MCLVFILILMLGWVSGAWAQVPNETPGRIGIWAAPGKLGDTGNATAPGNLTVDGNLNVHGSNNISGCPLITGFGGAGNDTTDNVAAFNAAIASNNVRPCVQFPVGVYRFNSGVAVSLNIAATGIVIQGAGSPVTVLHFPNGGGISVTENSIRQSARFAGFDITTGQQGGSEAIIFRQTHGAGMAGGLAPVSVFDHITCHGDDGYSANNYWVNCIHEHSVNNVNYNNLMLIGDGAFHGTGVTLDGVSGLHSTIHNFIGDQFFCLNRGIVHGSYVEGVTVTSGSNFVCGNVGIWIPGSSTNMDQLNVSDSSFNEDLYGILDDSGVPATMISHNVFIMGNGTVANSTGMRFNGTGSMATITGNNFQAGGPNSVGISVNSRYPRIIQANTFQFLSKGIVLEASSFQTRVTNDNEFIYVDVPITDLGLADRWDSNQVIGAGTWLPQLIGSGAAGQPVYSVRGGGYYNWGKWHTVTFTLHTTSWPGAVGEVQIAGLPWSDAGEDWGTCQITYMGGFVMPTGFFTVTGRIAPSSNIINLYMNNPQGGSMSAYPVANVNGNAIELVGSCTYHS